MIEGNPQKQAGSERPDVPGAVRATAAATDVSQEEPDEAQELVRRLEHLSTEVGWLLIYAGAIGFILPGVIGSPMLLAGLAVVTPGGPKRIARWIGRRPPRFVRGTIKQINRLLDDLDRRYPPLPKIGP
jgi:hypothetical protein